MERDQYIEKNQSPGWCLNTKTPQCSVPLNTRNCIACQQQHLKEALHKKPIAMDMETYMQLGPREKVVYVYDNKLWKRYADYQPHSDNVLSRKSRNLSKVRSFDKLSMGHILHTFTALKKEAEGNTRQKMKAEGMKPREIASTIQTLRDQQYKNNSEFKKDKHGNHIIDESTGEHLRNEQKDIIEETIRYNINTDKHSFKHHIGKLKNTLFDHYTSDRISEHDKKKFATILEIPSLTFKESAFSSLSNQIAAIIDGKHPRPDSLPKSPKNEELLNDYFSKIYEIEGFVMSDKYIGDSFIKEGFHEILGYMGQGDVFSDGDIVTVDTKNPTRAVEKIVNDYQLDMRSLTDISRGSIKCRSIKDMINKMTELFRSVDTYNKKANKSTTKPTVESMGLVSKMGPIDGLPPLSSGYGDAKYHIKFSNGSVVELQFQVDVFYKGKITGFDRLNGLSNASVIKRLGFTSEEEKMIRQQITDKGIELSGHDFFDLPDDYTLPGDTVYHIYRSLPGFDSRNTSNPTIKKLQSLEREIHMEGKLRNMKNIMQIQQKATHDKYDDNLRTKLSI